MSLTNATATPSAVTLFDTFSSGVVGVVASTLVTVVITVLITFFIQGYLNRPKITGKIFNVIRAEWSVSPENINRSAFFVYAYLTNQHKNAISILDYELECDFGKGFTKMLRVYGDVGKSIPSPLIVKNDKGEEISLRNLGQHLLYKEVKQVQYGRYIHGFVLFAGDISLHREKVKRYKLTCIDVFNKRHTLCFGEKEFVNFNLLLEILDTANSERGIYCP